MELESAIRGRRSIRAFTPDTVPRQTVQEILELVRWTPFWANVQDWSVFVVTGATLEKIRKANAERWASNAERRFEIARPRPDWPPEMAERTRQLIAARAPSIEAGMSTPWQCR